MRNQLERSKTNDAYKHNYSAREKLLKIKFRLRTKVFYFLIFPIPIIIKG